MQAQTRNLPPTNKVQSTFFLFNYPASTRHVRCLHPASFLAGDFAVRLPRCFLSGLIPPACAFLYPVLSTGLNIFCEIQPLFAGLNVFHEFPPFFSGDSFFFKVVSCNCSSFSVKQVYLFQ
jgi:hypothetical protein